MPSLEFPVTSYEDVDDLTRGEQLKFTITNKNGQSQRGMFRIHKLQPRPPEDDPMTRAIGVMTPSPITIMTIPIVGRFSHISRRDTTGRRKRHIIRMELWMFPAEWRHKNNLGFSFVVYTSNEQYENNIERFTVSDMVRIRHVPDNLMLAKAHAYVTKKGVRRRVYIGKRGGRYIKRKGKRQYMSSVTRK
jgi:hypothetical protein